MTIHIGGNESFAWDAEPIRYIVVASDTEDGDSLFGALSPYGVAVEARHVAEGYDSHTPETAEAGLILGATRGKELVEDGDCFPCHLERAEGPTAVPTYAAIAERFQGSSAARIFPDISFICYHLGFEPGKSEGPYDPDQDEGINRFIKAFQDQGLTPTEGNLYAELGGVCNAYEGIPDQAAHVIGKLLRYVGEDGICRGTDTVRHGSPQDQIQAMRTFQISEEFQETRLILGRRLCDRAAVGPLAVRAVDNSDT